MRNVISGAIVLVAVLAFFGPIVTAIGQEYKPGDEVVALRDTELKAGRETVGNARKGDKLTVEQVQDQWLWVRCGQTRGWIDSGRVLEAQLSAWYQSQPAMESDPERGEAGLRVGQSGRARAKVLGITLELLGVKPDSRPAVYLNVPNAVFVDGSKVIAGVITVWGHKAESPKDGVFLAYKRVAVQLERTSRESRSLMVNGKLWGTLRAGDHVLIDDSLRVFVNGNLRRPR
jgi:hypothetical protein